MHAGLDTKHDLAHQVYHRRKQQRPRILHFGGACKQRIDPLGIEQMLQHATGHHTDRSLFNKRFEDFPQRYRHLCPSFTGSLLLAGGTKLPNIAAPWKGCTRHSPPVNVSSWATVRSLVGMSCAKRALSSWRYA